MEIGNKIKEKKTQRIATIIEAEGNKFKIEFEDGEVKAVAGASLNRWYEKVEEAAPKNKSKSSKNSKGETVVVHGLSPEDVAADQAAAGELVMPKTKSKKAQRAEVLEENQKLFDDLTTLLESTQHIVTRKKNYNGVINPNGRMIAKLKKKRNYVLGCISEKLLELDLSNELANIPAEYNLLPENAGFSLRLTVKLTNIEEADNFIELVKVSNEQLFIPKVKEPKPAKEKKVKEPKEPKTPKEKKSKKTSEPEPTE